MPKTILKHAIVAIAIIMAVITTIVYLQSTGAKSKKQVSSKVQPAVEVNVDPALAGKDEKDEKTTKVETKADSHSAPAIPSFQSTGNPIPNFSAIADVKQKKRAYFDYLRPAAIEQNEYLLTLRTYIRHMHDKVIDGGALSQKETDKLNWLVVEYRVSDSLEPIEQLNALLTKVDIIPLDLVLVQSANESGWGTSRFAKEGYNFFGIWCFVENCGFVPQRRNSGAGHEVAKFDNLPKAMYSYMRNLNRHPAYRQLRSIRQELRKSDQQISGYALAEGLSSYSERGAEYIEELRAMMRMNKALMSTKI